MLSAMCDVEDDAKHVKWRSLQDEVGAENFTNAHQIWRICNASHDTDDLLLINEQTKSWIKSEGEHRIVSLTQDANIPEARWRMEHVRDDVYRFRNVRDNRCVLDLAAGLGGCGIKLYAWPEHGGPNQQWIMKQK
ncbi:hypothetical protein N7454_001537 [Penicillium verhagenii]|nr:hypothetical protein N7454_001537 [Penicillium verhagenii]